MKKYILLCLNLFCIYQQSTAMNLSKEEKQNLLFTHRLKGNPSQWISKERCHIGDCRKTERGTITINDDYYTMEASESNSSFVLFLFKVNRKKPIPYARVCYKKQGQNIIINDIGIDHITFTENPFTNINIWLSHQCLLARLCSQNPKANNFFVSKELWEKKALEGLWKQSPFQSDINKFKPIPNED